MEIVDDGRLLLFWNPAAPADEKAYRAALRARLGEFICAAFEVGANGRWRVDQAASVEQEDLRDEVARALRSAGLPVE